MGSIARALITLPFSPVLTGVHDAAPSVVLKTPPPKVPAYTVWGFPFELYRDILLYVRDKKIPLGLIEKAGLINFKKQGRLKLLTLTKSGEQVAEHIDSIRRLL